MKSLTKIHVLIGFLLMAWIYETNAQVTSDALGTAREYNDLAEALKSPQDVYRLNLSNQNILTLSDSLWGTFENLEYLSLKNDHLAEIPLGIGNLKNLKVLDLTGNDFEVLPPSFSRLENLIEIYLNDEKQMDVNQSLMALKDLPNLRILHLEDDNLDRLPNGLLYFTQLEALYLDNNLFNTLSGSILGKFENLEYLSLKNDHLTEIPFEIGNLKNLKVLDLSGNDFEVLPASFSRLESLTEIYLNDEKNMDVNLSLQTIENLPNLKILHLEDDNLESIPQVLLHLTHLESLYLNKNRFSTIPVELKELNNLNYIDLHDNHFKLKMQDMQYRDSFSLKIRI